MPAPVARSVVSPAATRTSHPTLSAGAKGPEVERLQRLLTRVGQDPHGIDGDFGANTKRAVEAFQKSVKLPVTGVANQATWSALEAKVSKLDAAAKQTKTERFVNATLPARRELLKLQRQVDAFTADGRVTASEKQQLRAQAGKAKDAASSLVAAESNPVLDTLAKVELMTKQGTLTAKAQDVVAKLRATRAALTTEAKREAGRAVLPKGWSQPFAGIATKDLTVQGLRAHVVAIDLADPRVKLQANAESERGKTVESFARNHGAEVAINGDFFSWGSYRPSGLAVTNGKQWAGTSNGFEGFLAFNGRHAEVAPPRTHNPDWSRNVISSRPTVLIDGKATATDPAKNERSARTGIGLSKSGRVLYLVAVEGKSGVRGLTGTELGKFMHSLGADDGVAMDSGGSAQLFVGGRGMVQRSTDPGGARAVANVLMVQSSGR
ncbi:MAG: phosphodiester glycosidase family protein [Myxococcaceae bacterium]